MSPFVDDTVERLRAIADPAVRFQAAGDFGTQTTRKQLYDVRCVAAVELAEARGLPAGRSGSRGGGGLRALARELGVHESNLRRWVERGQELRQEGRA